MLISDQKNFIFVHIYKTGGSSITRLLGPYVDECYRSKAPRTDDAAGWQGTWHFAGRQHDKLSALIADPAWRLRELDRYRICTFVRNPYTWALSVWNDFYRRAQDAPPSFSAQYPARRFPDYCRMIRAARIAGDDSVWGGSTQRSFVEHPRARPAFVGRFERLSSDVARLLEFLQIPARDPLSHEVQNRPDERAQALAFYDDESLAIVNELFEPDFAAFGYERIVNLDAQHETAAR